MRSWAKSFGEATLCILVLAGCLLAGVMSCRSCVRDVGCQLNGGEVVLKRWSATNGCTLTEPDASVRGVQP